MSDTIFGEIASLVQQKHTERQEVEEPTTPILTAPPRMLSPIRPDSFTRLDTRQGSLSNLLEKLNRNSTFERKDSKPLSLKAVLSESETELIKINGITEKLQKEHSTHEGLSTPLLTHAEPTLTETEANSLLQRLGSRSSSIRADDTEMFNLGIKIANFSPCREMKEEDKENEEKDFSPPTPLLTNVSSLLMFREHEGKTDKKSVLSNDELEKQSLENAEKMNSPEVEIEEINETLGEKDNSEEAEESQSPENKEDGAYMGGAINDQKEEMVANPNMIPTTVVEKEDDESSLMVSSDVDIEDNKSCGSCCYSDISETSGKHEDAESCNGHNDDVNGDSMMDCQDDRDTFLTAVDEKMVEVDTAVEGEKSIEEMDTNSELIPLKAPEEATTVVPFDPEIKSEIALEKKNERPTAIKRRRTGRKPSRRSRRLSGPATRAMTRPQTGVSSRIVSPKQIKRIAVNKPRKITTEKKTHRLQRETLNEMLFTPSDIFWNRWFVAMSPAKPNMSSKYFSPMDNGGYIHTELFNGVTNYIYELGIRGRVPCDTHYICGLGINGKVPGKMFSLFMDSVEGPKKKWYDDLLNSQELKEQIDNVMAQGCQVFVRRTSPVTSPVEVCGKSCRSINQIKRTISRRYDYAWCTNGRKTVRELTKKVKGVTINMSKP